MKRQTVLRPSGHTTITEAGSIVIEHDTVQCVHCGGHFPVNPHSAKGRGFCGNCNGPICGPNCIECVPKEKQLEIMEGTATRTAVSVPVFRVVSGRIPLIK